MEEEKCAIIFDLVVGVITILVLGCVIFLIPYHKASQRDAREVIIIDDYLEEQEKETVFGEHEDIEDPLPEEESFFDSTNGAERNDKGNVNTQYYRGEIDSILVMEKINLRKAIIRGNENDYNLSRYLFVTADQTSILGTDNYVIYGHCSQTYGHSFNRLDEIQIGDSFQLLQGTETYDYTVTDIQLELRENASPILNTGSNTVQLVSCEKKLIEGFPEKRLIIVTAVKSEE